MIELFDDFRDILVELHQAGARFVVLGGHAVAFHGHPRATNRADGITFAEAIADGESFELDGCKIPVIGRGALIKNKRAAGRPQDIADVKALADA
jgi:predicted nucleotidyltransferase